MKELLFTNQKGVVAMMYLLLWVIVGELTYFVYVWFQGGVKSSYETDSKLFLDIPSAREAGEKLLKKINKDAPKLEDVQTSATQYLVSGIIVSAVLGPISLFKFLHAKRGGGGT